MRAYLKGNEIKGKEIDFKIIDKLPKIGKELIGNGYYKDNQSIVYKIENIEIDCEQGSDDVYNYDYYKILYFDNSNYIEDDYDFNDCIYEKYVCIKKD